MEHSGKFGVVNGASTVRNWTAEDTAAVKAYSASNAKGGKLRSAGIRSWSGSYSGYGHTPLHLPGESFSFLGYVAPEDDTLGSNGYRLSGTALVSSVVINWAWTGEDVLINHVVNFAGHLGLAYADGAAITDATTPAEYNVRMIADAMTHSTDGFVANDVGFDHVTQMSLTITNDLKPYVNSSTVVANEIWTGQKPGHIDWTLALTYESTAKPLTLNTQDYSLRLWVDDTQYWALAFAKAMSYTGLNVDIESGSIVSQTVNLAMSAHDGAGYGHILEPGGTQFWP